jgi:NAD(P)-dependent dehydrogenase (short-subunit alcohol dehydrogenase family)
MSEASETMAQRKRERVALVTGATSGIGRAVAHRLAGEGTTVLVVGRDSDRGEQVVAEVGRRGGRGVFLRADLSDAGAVVDLAGRAHEAAAGPVDVLVHSAGVGTIGPTADIGAEVLDLLWAVNVRAPFLLTGRLAPRMADRGHGSIINVSSIASGRGIDGFSAYAVTKAAIDQLTRSWTAEFGPRGVRVNGVAPGSTDTAMIEPAPGVFIELARQAPMRRLADPDEVAAAVAWLASSESHLVQGAVIPVDGGWAAV